MPPVKHAVLSASASHRWLHCNPSARLELEFNDRETAAAAEGTAAHALCEHKLRRKLKLRSERPISNFDNDEMEQHTDDYTDFVMEQVIRERRRDAETQVLIEQRLDFSCYANAFFVNANSATAPQIVDARVQPILERGEVYSGVYARVSINFYAFNSSGNKGIACGLGNIQKVRDGEPLGGKTKAEDDFGELTGEADDLL